MATGIQVRHRNGCPALTDRDAACRCKPAFRAWVYDRRSGRKVRKTFDSLSEAKLWRSDAVGGVKRGTVAAATRLTVRELGEQWVAAAERGEARNRSGDAFRPSVLRGYRRSLEQRIYPEAGAVRVSDLRREDLQRVADRLLADGLDASTVRNHLMPVRTAFRWALVRGLAHSNPTSGLELPAARGRRDRIASPEEATKLIAALPRVDDRALWGCALFGGLRRGEIRALKWGAVDLANGAIRVVAGMDDREGLIKPKSRAGKRVVPVVGALRDLLTEWRAVAPDTRDDTYVFPGLHGGPFTPSAVRRRAEHAWTTRRRKAGLDEFEPIGLHEARHSFASVLIAAGVNAKAITTFLGHSSIQITFDRYGHLLRGSEAEAVELVDAYLTRANTASRVEQLTA
jgi:integrase